MINFIEPTVVAYREANPLVKVEHIARVCTASEDRITPESALPFCQRLLGRSPKHTSPFEHTRVVVPQTLYLDIRDRYRHKTLPYGFVCRCQFGGSTGAATEVWMNGRDFLTLGGTLEELLTCEEAPGYLTLLFTTDIGISRELCRHRQMSFMERSTRYVKFDSGVDMVLPLPLSEGPDGWTATRLGIWREACSNAANAYVSLRSAGCSPQEARNVLPLSTATKLYVTGRYDQWREVIRLREGSGAHPEVAYLMSLVKKEMTED